MSNSVILTGNHILSSVRWAGRRTTNMHTGFLENVKDSEHLEELGIDGRIILEWILKKLDGNVWNGFIGLRIGTNGRMCECGNEPSCSIKFSGVPRNFVRGRGGFNKFS